MYITICKIDDQCKFDDEAGHSKLVIWDNPRDGVGREVGWGFRMVGHMYTHG